VVSKGERGNGGRQGRARTRYEDIHVMLQRSLIHCLLARLVKLHKVGKKGFFEEIPEKVRRKKIS
jgi:hypothetical protein